MFSKVSRNGRASPIQLDMTHWMIFLHRLVNKQCVFKHFDLDLDPHAFSWLIVVSKVWPNERASQFIQEWHPGSIFLQCLVPKFRGFEHLTRWTGGHLGFDLSRPSEVKFDFPPHLKINLMTCPSYARNFMLFSLNAQLLWLSAVLIRTRQLYTRETMKPVRITFKSETPN